MYRVCQAKLVGFCALIESISKYFHFVWFDFYVFYSFICSAILFLVVTTSELHLFSILDTNIYKGRNYLIIREKFEKKCAFCGYSWVEKINF